MTKDRFVDRHIGPRENEIKEMLHSIEASSVDELIKDTIPAQILMNKELDLPEGVSEFEYLKHIDALAAKNVINKNFIGMGYYGTIIPSAIRRNILENPGWYTAYTPYQAEISQGRLEGLLNFQTMVSDLTGMEMANASLLDEATAAAEAMIMLYNSRSRQDVKAGRNEFFVSINCYPQTIDLIKTRAIPLGIDVVFGDHKEYAPSENTFGVLLQYPAEKGDLPDYRDFASKVKEIGAHVAVASDLLSLCLLVPPGEWGADVVVGNSQRFGVPLGYGGPHAAFFATKEEYKRHIPGRIIGVSVDREGRNGLRMALQTREQHIKREKATSNICTAQALLAIMAGMYATYHGADGLKGIAEQVHDKAKRLAESLNQIGFENANASFFDTLQIKVSGDIDKLNQLANDRGINLRYVPDLGVGISLDETHTDEEIQSVIDLFAEFAGVDSPSLATDSKTIIGDEIARSSAYLTHPTFSSYRSESDLMRYIKSLENKDISLTRSMITLGSCTMKLNAASELYPITNPAFANLHPFAPVDQAKGYHEMIDRLERWLSEITGFHSVTFQPNSGAQGEYAGLMTIRAYHMANGDSQRNIALIPSSAHGTNPASAVMAGMNVVAVKTDEEGNIDIEDLKAKAELHSNNLAALMVTYPSTHGVFEEGIKEITSIIHQHGGQVYMDGANMNAQVGLTSPGLIGADVCHLNLHKTFAIPHGGGGPGVGPIGVAEHLSPFLPGHAVIKTGGEQAISAISGAPFGSSLILLISYGYVMMLGQKGVKKSTEIAILNANYMKSRLESSFPILYIGKSGRAAHEMIIDCREFKKTAKVEVEDIAKRLIDYGYHAPTVSFPVAGTMMIEPTESESKAELDRFCDAMIQIRKEINEIEEGTEDEFNNVLKNAPHTAETLLSNVWDFPYSRWKAAYPLNWVRLNKYWPPVARIDNAHGDRNLICTCPSIESYEQEPENGALA